MIRSYYVFVTGVCVVPERHQHAVHWWFVGGYSGRTLELTQANRPEGPADCGCPTCSVRIHQASSKIYTAEYVTS